MAIVLGSSSAYTWRSQRSAVIWCRYVQGQLMVCVREVGIALIFASIKWRDMAYRVTISLAREKAQK